MAGKKGAKDGYRVGEGVQVVKEKAQGRREDAASDRPYVGNP